MEENKELTSLPEKWWVQSNESNYIVIYDWLRKNKQNNNDYLHLNIKDKNIEVCYPIYGIGHQNKGDYSYTEITFDQFKKWVLKESIEKEYQCNSIPENAIKLRVIKDIENKIINSGNLPEIIKAGSITWIHSNYIQNIGKTGNVHIENNRYSANIPSTYFEIIVEENNEIPEYVECIKWEGYSHKAGVIYKVTDGYIDHEIRGSKSLYKQQITNFKPSTKEAYNLQNSKQSVMSDNELLEEAKRRYPIGTKFKSVCDGNRIREVIPYNKEKSNTITWYLTDSGKTVRSCNGISANGEDVCSNPSVYKNGKWAEIISKPEIKEESESLVGRYVKNLCDRNINSIKKGEYLKLIKHQQDNIYEAERWGSHLSIDHIEDWELMPEEFKPDNINQKFDDIIDELTEKEWVPTNPLEYLI